MFKNARMTYINMRQWTPRVIATAMSTILFFFVLMNALSWYQHYNFTAPKTTLILIAVAFGTQLAALLSASFSVFNERNLISLNTDVQVQYLKGTLGYLVLLIISQLWNNGYGSDDPVTFTSLNDFQFMRALTWMLIQYLCIAIITCTGLSHIDYFPSMFKKMSASYIEQHA